MVHPQEDRNNTLQQAREGEHREEPGMEAGRPPYPGEIVGRKEAPFEVTGLDALSPLFANIRFPATKEEIIAQIGEAQIPIDKWRLAPAADLIRLAGADEFPSSRELEVAINRAFHEHPPSESRGSYHWQRDNVDGRRTS